MKQKQITVDGAVFKMLDFNGTYESIADERVCFKDSNGRGWQAFRYLLGTSHWDRAERQVETTMIQLLVRSPTRRGAARRLLGLERSLIRQLGGKL